MKNIKRKIAFLGLVPLALSACDLFGPTNTGNPDDPGTGGSQTETHTHSYDHANPVWTFDAATKKATLKLNCSGCEVPATITVDASVKSQTAATCTEAGSIVYEASATLDSEEFSKVFDAVSVSALGHSMEHHEAVAPTCTQTGTKEYWTCSHESGVLYKDANGTETFANADELVVAKIAHSLTHIPAVAATCTTDGHSEYWECSACEGIFGDAQGTQAKTLAELEISATGHDMTHHAANAATCTAAGNLEYWECSHEPGVFYKDANGEQQYANEAATVVAAKGHDMTHVEAKSASCTEAGNLEYWTCANELGVFYKDENGAEAYANEAATVVAKLPHNLVYHEAVASTCTAKGHAEYWECSECNHLFADSQGTQQTDMNDLTYITFGDHDFENVTPKAATCTESGIESDIVHCKVCDKYFYSFDTSGTMPLDYNRDVVIAATGHDMEHHAANAATCTAAGNLEYWTCSHESGVFYKDANGAEKYENEAATVVAKLAHNLTHHAAVAETCGAAGTIEYWHCENCDKNFSDDQGNTQINSIAGNAATGAHSYGTPSYEWAEDGSTCTATVECGVCGDVIEETADATSNVTADPTILEVGTETFSASFNDSHFTTQTKDIDIEKLDTVVSYVTLQGHNKAGTLTNGEGEAGVNSEMGYEKTNNYNFNTGEATKYPLVDIDLSKYEKVRFSILYTYDGYFWLKDSAGNTLKEFGKHSAWDEFEIILNNSNYFDLYMNGDVISQNIIASDGDLSDLKISCWGNINVSELRGTLKAAYVSNAVFVNDCALASHGTTTVATDYPIDYCVTERVAYASGGNNKISLPIYEAPNINQFDKLFFYIKPTEGSTGKYTSADKFQMKPVSDYYYMPNYWTRMDIINNGNDTFDLLDERGNIMLNDVTASGLLIEQHYSKFAVSALYGIYKEGQGAFTAAGAPFIDTTNMEASTADYVTPFEDNSKTAWKISPTDGQMEVINASVPTSFNEMLFYVKETKSGFYVDLYDGEAKLSSISIGKDNNWHEVRFVNTSSTTFALVIDGLFKKSLSYSEIGNLKLKLYGYRTFQLSTVYTR